MAKSTRNSSRSFNDEDVDVGDPSNIVFVPGVVNKTTYEAMAKTFGQHGVVKEIKIIVDREDEENVFAFVTMNSIADATRCIDMIGPFDGYRGRLRYAQPRSDICFSYQRGYCYMGEHCLYCHECPVARKVDCYEFRMGRCMEGNSCRFNHDLEGEVYAPKKK